MTALPPSNHNLNQSNVSANIPPKEQQPNHERHTLNNSNNPENKTSASVTSRKSAIAPKNPDEFFKQIANIAQTKTENFNQELQAIRKTDTKARIAIQMIIGTGSTLASASMITLGLAIIIGMATSIVMSAGIGLAVALLLFAIGIIVIKSSYNILDKKIQNSGATQGAAVLLEEIFYLYTEYMKNVLAAKVDLQNLDYPLMLKNIEQLMEDPNFIGLTNKLLQESLICLNIREEKHTKHVESTKTRVVELMGKVLSLVFDHIEHNLPEEERKFLKFTLRDSLNSYADKSNTKKMIHKILSLSKRKQASDIVTRVNFGDQSNENLLAEILAEAINNYQRQLF